jgi:two-component sensor histidine kinase/ligand-binding sensor domain-containing protein
MKITYLVGDFMKALLTIFLWIGVSFWVSAQKLNFRQFSLDKGLTQTTINKMFEDSRGYLWVGTSGGGLCRFDGEEFVAYGTDQGLEGLVITDIAEDHLGKLWLSTTWGGLACFNGVSFENIGRERGLKTATANCLFFDNKNELLYAGFNDALVRIDPATKKFSQFTIPGRKNLRVLSIAKVPGHKGLICGTNAGLIGFDGHRLSPISTRSGLDSLAIKFIAVSPRGELLIPAESNGLRKLVFSGNQFVDSEFDIGLSRQINISHLYFDRNNRLWISTAKNGLWCLEDGKLTHYSRSLGLGSSEINQVLQGRTGSIWIGTRDGGVVKFYDRGFVNYKDHPFLAAGDIFGLITLPDGKILFSSLDGEIFVRNGEEVTRNYPGLPSTGVLRGFYQWNQRFLVFGNSGVFEWKNGRFVPFPPPVLGPDQFVRCMNSTPDGALWMGLHRGGLCKFIDNKYFYYNESTGAIKNNYCYSMAVDSSGTLWAGTGDGVMRFNGTKFVPYGNPCNLYIGCMAADRFGRIWIGSDKCLQRISASGMHDFSYPGMAPNGPIYLLHFDRYGDLWVGNNRGITRLVMNSSSAPLYGEFFSSDDGFLGMECNSRAVAMDTSGHLWVSTVGGIIMIDIEKIRKKESDLPPTINLQSVLLFFGDTAFSNYSGAYQPWLDIPIHPVLPFSKNHITFHFKAIDKKHPKGFRYSFFLEGFDQRWSPNTQEDYVSYSNLPPGSYKFKVMAKTIDNLWTKDPLVYEFTILAPWYRNPWVIVSVFLVLSLSVFLVIYFRRKRREIVTRRLEEGIRVRTAEIQRKNEEKEVLLKEIHHRVKNNLQVVNSLLNLQASYLEDERSRTVFYECQNRIRAISLIHEKLYRSDDFIHIDIKEYLDLLLKDLISVYSIDTRVHLRFDLSIKYLNLNTLVPLGLLLNEVISNSLKYGFPQHQEGLIVVSIFPHLHQKIEMIVGDNGIGYQGDLKSGNSGSLGFELILTLTEQLDGTIEKLPLQGTWYRLIFGIQKD